MSDASPANLRRPRASRYAGPTVPPPGYSLETEVEGVRRVADDAGFGTFHLVGYSAGGASALAFASRYPGRLRSLALMEPVWAGRTGQTPEEAAVYDRFRAIPEMAPEEIMPAFIRTQLADGVEPPTPPPGPPPPWMPSRLAALGTFMAAFDAFEPDFDVLRRFDQPVYFALGGRGNPDLYVRIAERLAGAFPDFTLDVFEERHHFDPPHRVEPARLAVALRERGQTWAGPLIWWAHRDEVVSKLGSNAWRWTNTIQEQFYCHIAGLPFSLPTYNLESWRPFVGWAVSLAQYQCNPNEGGWSS